MKYCIFVERIFDDKCFEALKLFCIGHDVEKVHLFCLTPTNYNLVCAEQGYNGTKEELSKIMAERYKELEALGCQIDLHVHLGLRLENINQTRVIGEAKYWMDSNRFNPKTITFGWYIYNDESLLVSKINGLTYFKDKWFFSFHDYEYDKKYAMMMIITNLRGMLR